VGKSSFFRFFSLYFYYIINNLNIDIFVYLFIILDIFLHIIRIPMKKIVLLFSLIALLFPLFSFAKQWCCSWHWWVSYCASNWRYVCNDWTYSPSCTCGSSYSSTSYYRSNTVSYLTNDQKCNMKYPGTVYRYWDGRCACSGDPIWTSSWSSTYGCSLKAGVSSSYYSKSDKDIQCNKKYPWTIYRGADNWCACQGDRVWTSSWNKYTKSC